MVAAHRRRARRGEGDRLREEILTAAERLLVVTGDQAAVSIRAIAEDVGCTPAALYLHFPDKIHLMLTVCERHFDALDAAIEAAGAEVDDPVEALARRARAYVEFGLANPEAYRIIFLSRQEQAPDFTVDDGAAGTRAFVHLVQAVERCMEAGAFRREDPVLVATAFWSLVHGVTSLAISMPGFPPHGIEDLLDHLLEGQRRALAPDGGGRAATARQHRARTGP